MEKKVFFLNQDHRGISRIVPVILIVLLFVTYRIYFRNLPTFFGGQSGDYLLIAGLCAVFTSALILWLIDPLVKNLLPSGHVLTLEPQEKSMVYAVQNDVKKTLANQDSWQVTRWFFRMGRFVKSGRERQIPNGWYCMALHLKAGEEEMTLFCYAQPRKQRRFARDFEWNEISMFDTLEEKRNPAIPVMRPPTLSASIPSRLLVGEKGHIWLCERKRREDGLEMTPKDFRQLLEKLAV